METWTNLLNELESINHLLVSPIFSGNIDTRDLQNTSLRLDGATVAFARLRQSPSLLKLEHSRWHSTTAKGLVAYTEAERALLMLCRAWRRLYLLQSQIGGRGVENVRSDLDDIC